MATALRIEYPGAAYHVMARGNHGQDTFQDDSDRRLFLETLGEACERTGWSVNAQPEAGTIAAAIAEVGI